VVQEPLAQAAELAAALNTGIAVAVLQQQQQAVSDEASIESKAASSNSSSSISDSEQLIEAAPTTVATTATGAAGARRSMNVESDAPPGGESREAVSTDVVAGDTAAAGTATSAACSVLHSSSGQIALSVQSSATAVSIHFCTIKAHYRTCFAVPAASSRTCTVLFLSCLRICYHCT
jgi:hypothetical protein